MTPQQSPIARILRSLGAHMEPYGELAIEIAQAFGPIELEYSAIRKGCALFDEPHRALIEVRGHDRVEFLNRMLTQELKGITPGEVRRSFWLNRKGRIDADLRVVELGDRTLLELDAHALAPTIEALSAFLFSEDVRIDSPADAHRITLHGPLARERIAPIVGLDAGVLGSLTPNLAIPFEIDATSALLLGEDLAGERSVGVVAPARAITHIVERLLDLHATGDAPVRPIGWQALNIARIESGHPLYLIDFGTSSLPGETGLLDSRVSFTKGCYLGQEVVARMRSLGHPKQVVVGLRISPEAGRGPDDRSLTHPDPPGLIPDAGTPLFALGDAGISREVGAITSATLSPMLGSAPVAFASVRWGHHEAGTELSLTIDGRAARAGVQPSLAFWRH